MGKTIDDFLDEELSEYWVKAELQE